MCILGLALQGALENSSFSGETWYSVTACQVATLGSLSELWNPLQACCLTGDPQGLILLIWQGFDLGNTSKDFFVQNIIKNNLDVGLGFLFLFLFF